MVDFLEDELSEDTAETPMKVVKIVCMMDVKFFFIRFGGSVPQRRKGRSY